MNRQANDIWHPPVILKKYGSSFVLALVITTLLGCIYVIYQIRYGNVIITKKTLTPYYILLIYLLLLLGESIEKCILIEQYGASEE